MPKWCESKTDLKHTPMCKERASKGSKGARDTEIDFCFNVNAAADTSCFRKRYSPQSLERQTRVNRRAPSPFSRQPSTLQVDALQVQCRQRLDPSVLVLDLRQSRPFERPGCQHVACCQEASITPAVVGAYVTAAEQLAIFIFFVSLREGEQKLRELWDKKDAFGRACYVASVNI